MNNPGQPPPVEANPVACLLFRPLPVKVQVAYFDTGHEVITSIAREWNEGDIPRCRRCSPCVGRDDRCLLMVNEEIPWGQAADFSPVMLGLEVQGR